MEGRGICSWSARCLWRCDNLERGVRASVVAERGGKKEKHHGGPNVLRAGDEVQSIYSTVQSI